MKTSLTGLIGAALIWAGIWCPLAAEGVEEKPPYNQVSPVELDSVGSDSSQNTEGTLDSAILVQHGFNHKEQVIVGSVFMVCLALILTTMNNYNPKEN